MEINYLSSRVYDIIIDDQKISKLISMATEMQDNQDENGQKRRQRKIELCDEIIDELTDMILFLEKVMNDYVNYFMI